MKPSLNTLTICLLILFSFQSIFACRCEVTPPPCYEYSKSDAVFIGTVKEIKRNEIEPEAKIKLEVNKNYKGANGSFIKAKTFGSSCDFETFTIGKKYLIYGKHVNKNKDFIYTNYCSRSTLFKPNLIDLDFLNSLDPSKPSYLIWGTITFPFNKPYKVVQTKVFDDRGHLVGTSIENENIKLYVSKAGKYKVIAYPPKDMGVNLGEILNSQFQYKLKEIKNYDLNKKKPFVEYEVEVKANKCGWFHLPLLNQTKK